MTRVFEVPVTVAVNCCCVPVVMVGFGGFTVTVTFNGCGAPVIAGLKVPLPPQPERATAAKIAAKTDKVVRVRGFMVLKSVRESDVQAARVAETWSEAEARGLARDIGES
jgi:hypothetical protein